jgi:hypothetical protein
MSKFYTNISVAKNKILVRGYANGKHFAVKEVYKPYLFIPTSTDSKYRNLNGEALGRMDFDTMSDARDFISKYKEVDNMSIYGMTNYQYTYIYDNYKGMIDYDPSLVSVVGIDIETDMLKSRGFPDIQQAENEITLITISRNGRMSTFGCGEFDNKNPDKVTYYHCADEVALLRVFL